MNHLEYTLINADIDQKTDYVDLRHMRYVEIHRVGVLPENRNYHIYSDRLIGYPFIY